MLTDKSVFLRAIEDSDSQFYYKWINDPETNDLRGLYFPTSYEEPNLSNSSHLRKNSTLVKPKVL